MNRKTWQARLLKRARELAATGKYERWHDVDAELQLQLGESLILSNLVTLQIRAQLDLACMVARELRADILASQRIRAELHRICMETRNLRKAREATRSRKTTISTTGPNGGRRLNADQKRMLIASDVTLYVKQSARARYDQGIEQLVNRMRPEMLDQLLRDDEA